MNKDENMDYGQDYKFVPTTSINSGAGMEVRSDIYCQTIQIVNICFVGEPETKEFVLVDAGMPQSADDIIAATEERFGANQRPKAIILTHGHFDHVGAIIELIKHWKVPVYAHELELPYLTGESQYPEPDPSVEGGLVAKISPIFPNDPIQLADHIEPLPANGEIIGMPGWRWIHTPGHTPGHVSLFREQDRSLVVGDAFVTVKQESLYKVFTQEQEISGPPKYFTPDWESAWASVKKLAALKPAVAITGHGVPVSGERLQNGLKRLVEGFEEIAIPEHGRYVNGNQD